MPDYHETPPPQGGEVIYQDELGNVCTSILFPDGTPLETIDTSLYIITLVEALMPLLKEDIHSGRFPL